MINYKKWNAILGWCFFAIATIVYLITIEDTVSLWDCGEYITAAYKLEVGHPPGAPLFLLLVREDFKIIPEYIKLYGEGMKVPQSILNLWDGKEEFDVRDFKMIGDDDDSE